MTMILSYTLNRVVAFEVYTLAVEKVAIIQLMRKDSSSLSVEHF